MTTAVSKRHTAFRPFGPDWNTRDAPPAGRIRHFTVLLGNSHSKGVALALLFADDMRKFMVVVVVASLFACTAFVSVRQRERWTEKLDAPLLQAAHSDHAESVRAVIRVRPGAADQFVAHLSQQHALTATRIAIPDAVVVDAPNSMLKRLALDPDVLHLSADATNTASK